MRQRTFGSRNKARGMQDKTESTMVLVPFDILCLIFITKINATTSGNTQLGVNKVECSLLIRT